MEEAPEYFQINAYSDDTDAAGADRFIVEELLDFSNDDDTVIADDAGGGGGFFNSENSNASTGFLSGNSAESSAVTVLESCNSSSFSGCEPNSFFEDSNFGDANFSGELCVPYDDLAELEWLSNIVEESFSSEDMQKFELISGVKVKPEESTQTRLPTTRTAAAIFKPDIVSVPAKARSKRPRAVPSNWNNAGLLHLSPTTSSSDIAAAVLSYPVKKNPPKVATAKKKDSPEAAGVSTGEGRKCVHCATDKTPQWRTGPMGPKTLCNACGVRFKSGRLVPEYRPAASPTFVLTQHSNSHRKVMELRRQKEVISAQQPQPQPQLQQLILDDQDMIFDSSNDDDYLIHQHVGPDFRHLV